jgi:hypothetical protein
MEQRALTEACSTLSLRTMRVRFLLEVCSVFCQGILNTTELQGITMITRVITSPKAKLQLGSHTFSFPNPTSTPLEPSSSGVASEKKYDVELAAQISGTSFFWNTWQLSN